MGKLKIGFVGAGKMAAVMADTLRRMDSVETLAVAARDGERARLFAAEQGFAKSYGSYEEMLAAGEIDLAYISTTISHHFEQAMLCLDYGVPVLCEKAFTANAREAEELLGRARREGILVAEAIWTRYMPFSATLRRLVDEGVVGKPRLLSANLGFNVQHNARLTDPALGGGALLDIGIYPLNFSLMTFGDDIASTQTSATLTPTGVDETETVTLNYSDGRIATFYSTMATATNHEGIIHGDKGFLVVDNVNDPLSAKLYDNDRQFVREYTAPAQISGYEYQIEACAKALAEKRCECPDMPHSEIIAVMRRMDALRAEWGVRYPADEA